MDFLKAIQDCEEAKDVLKRSSKLTDRDQQMVAFITANLVTLLGPQLVEMDERIKAIERRVNQE